MQLWACEISWGIWPLSPSPWFHRYCYCASMCTTLPPDGRVVGCTEGHSCGLRCYSAFVSPTSPFWLWDSSGHDHTPALASEDLFPLWHRQIHRSKALWVELAYWPMSERLLFCSVWIRLNRRKLAKQVLNPAHQEPPGLQFLHLWWTWYTYLEVHT